MRSKIIAALFQVVFAFALPPAHAQAIKQFVGTVSAFKPETAEIEIKPDNAAAVLVKTTPSTLASRIAPGAKDLKGAEAILITDVALGDRVLVALEPGTSDLRRIVVMSASDIAKHDSADKMDWTKRGVSGVVAAKIGNEVTLRIRGLQGETKATVVLTDTTSYRRYAPDSVKFADARKSGLAEVAMGDQLRARGQKSEDGLKVTADEVVFGTFLTKAGTIVSVDPAAGSLTVKEMGTGSPLTVKFTPDSQVKKMPDFGGTQAGGPGRGPGMMPGATAPPGMQPGPGRAGGPPDLAQMIERLPSVKLDDFKAGETIVVSSTKGAKPAEVTAIVLLGNAGMLIQMASAPGGAGGRAGGGAAGASGVTMGGGLEMPSIVF